MDPHNNEGRTKFKAFPYVSAPDRNLMVDLVSTVENRLDSQLLPCTLPPDVQYYQYQNQSGTGVASPDFPSTANLIGLICFFGLNI
jgi:red chlorophyll catabolite reductase